MYLNEATLLNNIKIRYKHDKIYVCYTLFLILKKMNEILNHTVEFSIKVNKAISTQIKNVDYKNINLFSCTLLYIFQCTFFNVRTNNRNIRFIGQEHSEHSRLF